MAASPPKNGMQTIQVVAAGWVQVDYQQIQPCSRALANLSNFRFRYDKFGRGLRAPASLLGRPPDSALGPAPQYPPHFPRRRFAAAGK